jgi:hypothetical protein
MKRLMVTATIFAVLGVGACGVLGKGKAPPPAPAPAAPIVRKG